LPGTFEHAMNHLIISELDLSDFHARFKNDVKGAAAYLRRHVTVRGTLFHANTGHHHTPVLIQVDRIEKIRY
jgi:hypothetical protein